MNISKTGVDLIKFYESCRLTAYKPDPAETYYTIGWGHYGPDVYLGMTITQSQADNMFNEDIVRYVRAVDNASLGFTPNQNQFDALSSFCYNLGVGIMADFTGMTASQVAAEMPLYVHGSGGTILPGLVSRRQKEVSLFNSGTTGGDGGGPENGDEEILSQYYETGIAYPNISINIRTKPCATTGTVLDQYHKGESVIYDQVIITNKYVWISWLPAAGGNRVYMTVKNVISGERYAECKDVPNNGGTAGAEAIQDRYAENGIAYPNISINIRTNPCATTGIVLDQYHKGESVIYDQVVITNKYVWISWLSAGSGNRVYMTVKDIISGERYAECKDVPGGSPSAEVIMERYTEQGTAYPKISINIRTKPCATTGTVLDQYHKGESVIYNQVIITNKYVWISWFKSDGKTRVYMTIKDLITGERFADCV